MRKNILLIFLLFFLSIGAIGGGVSLIISPSGGIIHMPIDNLKYSPFHDFLIPGILLLVFIGIFPLIVAISLIKRFDCKTGKILSIDKKNHWSLNFSMYAGITLAVFEIVEVIMLQSIHWLHIAYFSLGILIIIVSIVEMRRKG